MKSEEEQAAPEIVETDEGLDFREFEDEEYLGDAAALDDESEK